MHIFRLVVDETDVKLLTICLVVQKSLFLKLNCGNLPKIFYQLMGFTTIYVRRTYCFRFTSQILFHSTEFVVTLLHSSYYQFFHFTCVSMFFNYCISQRQIVICFFITFFSYFFQLPTFVHLFLFVLFIASFSLLARPFQFFCFLIQIYLLLFERKEIKMVKSQNYRTIFWRFSVEFIIFLSISFHLLYFHIIFILTISIMY